jgi:hypothetical protein
MRKSSSRRKVIIGAVVGLVLLALVLILVFTLHKSDDGPWPPSPPPPPDNNPLDFVEYNPFTVSDQDYKKQDWFVNGILNLSNTTTGEYRKLTEEGGEMKYRPVDPDQVPTGLNNKVPEQVAFNFSLINNYQARIQIGAVGGNNYSVPNETSPRNVQEFEARLTQLGFGMS